MLILTAQHAPPPTPWCNPLQFSYFYKMNENGIIENKNNSKKGEKRSKKGNPKKVDSKEDHTNSDPAGTPSGNVNNGNTPQVEEKKENNTEASNKNSVTNLFSWKKKKNKQKKCENKMEENNSDIHGNSLKTSPYVNLGDDDINEVGEEGDGYYDQDNNNDVNDTQENYQESNATENYDNENENIAIVDVGGNEKNAQDKEEEKKRKKNWKRRTFSRFTPGGVRSSTVLFICTAIGVGFLSIPYVFLKLGIILSLLLILLNGMESYVTTNILCMTSLEHNTFVYGNLLKKIGHKYHKTIIDIGLTFGFLSSYILVLILISNFLSSILYVFNFPSFLYNHNVLIIIVCSLIVPITLRDQVGSLDSFLIFSLCSLMITVLTIGWQARGYYTVLINKDIVLFNMDRHFFKCFNILLFSFSQQPNACFITGQFNQPTHRRLTKSAYRSVVLQIIFYSLFGLLGYLSFLTTTKDNIILNYEDTNISILLCKFLLSITFFFSVPLNFMGSYSSLLSLYLSARNMFLKFYVFVSRRNRYMANLSTFLREDEDNIFEDNALDNLTENSSTTESQAEDRKQRRLISICVTILCAFIAFNVKKLSNVIGIGGGITSTLISCLLPNLIYFKNRHNVKNKLERYSTLCMLCFFSFMGFFSVITTALILIF
ncbi:transmembrane amino acid transporter protein, putative [Plasmodium knowlesi strain H]|uniref:Transmembrane amino acid transporter protein, putative n=3 Tax=Plasmodium knowlesi TaxID=5850 RepID=A0A5K1VDE4_PLAKH|nr:amino acid transporter AAT1, putative [Plasmodium knowlesi strain H]OTN64795.1 putative Transmembrane amino acid transporter protein [Plasmodium knowlesi]CAA9989028.1 amino acid transporter AAT1, putative [Plasmodium knowlesi strain H]SBO24872.1 transmembrane amino acid transporter protein, putative [Plasmodium knowlesi strain H]SBO27548.1 transmembrane amino acid transporter protein, putative [Plasmodium knowlesi strain H]VVS78502.1 amino acid transporter AAT1, putative [Plasmodium knowles|eukprot:XP_002261376.1 transmembrane amino acid transporter protein,putative [Plasmodium knowlesi strain H]